MRKAETTKSTASLFFVGPAMSGANDENVCRKNCHSSPMCPVITGGHPSSKCSTLRIGNTSSPLNGTHIASKLPNFFFTVMSNCTLSMT